MQEVWSGFILSRKLNMLKNKIKEWASSNGGSVAKRKEVALHELEELDKLEEKRDLLEEEICSRSLCKARLWNCFRLEEIEWQQKSRSLWLKEGQKNSIFFPLWLI